MENIILNILKILEKEEYEVYGLRADDHLYNVGDTCLPSRELWQDEVEGLPYNDNLGFWIGDELDGTSAIKITADNIEEALDLIDYYKNWDGYDNLYLIGSEDFGKGTDDGEIIMYDPKVLAVLY